MTHLDLLGTIDATQISPGLYLVSAHGPIDARVASELRDVLAPLAAADGTAVVLDLGDAHGLDDEVLGVVAQAAHVVARRGDRLAVVSASDTVRRSICASGLDLIVALHRSTAEAIGQ